VDARKKRQGYNRKEKGKGRKGASATSFLKSRASASAFPRSYQKKREMRKKKGKGPQKGESPNTLVRLAGAQKEI